MKAERRHELQTNTLAQFLSDLPLYFRFHANKILFGVIILCLVIMLVRYRMQATALAREAAISSLTGARDGLQQLQIVDRAQSNDADRARQRKITADGVQLAIDQVLEGTTDAKDAAVRAEAIVTRGDLNWELARLPRLAGAATQPGLELPQKSEAYYRAAEEAYLRVVRDYPTQKVQFVAALFGLAAIEENRGNWEKAIEYYNKVTADENVATVLKAVARQRLSIIPQIRQPVYMGNFSSTQPTSQPTLAPATQP